MTRSGVVAFAFGVPDTLRSNQRIARMAESKAKELHAPIYTQRDVRITPTLEVMYIEEQENNPPPTLRIARGAVRWAEGLGLTQLWIACALPHLWRCRRDLEYAVHEAGLKITIQVCEDVRRYPQDEWFCPDSTQPRVRSREEWRKRERIVELMPMFVYKKVAS